MKAWDQYTIEHEPVPSVDLMERAAKACTGWICSHFNKDRSFSIFCGKGNNGGDGLAIARLLINEGYSVAGYVVETGATGSADFRENMGRLNNRGTEIHYLKTANSFPLIPKGEVIIDALFGTGLNKVIGGIYKSLIDHLNDSGSRILSIDMPSGLFADRSSLSNSVIRARDTLSFQQPKLAFFMPENQSYLGRIHILDIGLSTEFAKKESSKFEQVDQPMVRQMYRPGPPFAHKGDFGHAGIIAGSYGMIGAAVLSARACLRSGAGKITVYTCRQGYNILQTSAPEVMCKVFGNTYVKDVGKVADFDALGIGPGIGQYPTHRQLLQTLFKRYRKPIVIDADALNVLSKNPSLYSKIPPHSILTPHPKEFERLFGKTSSDFERVGLALKKAKKLDVFIILKGHHTLICTPGGKGYFNNTGNPGMATAGSGDVLTGILTGLLARKYPPLHATLLGVYLHGFAGDIAAKRISEESMISSDIIESLGDAYQEISREA